MCNLIVNWLKLKDLDRDMYPGNFLGDEGDKKSDGDKQASGGPVRAKKLKKG
jgi:hypothetical protein